MYARNTHTTTFHSFSQPHQTPTRVFNNDSLHSNRHPSLTNTTGCLSVPSTPNASFAEKTTCHLHTRFLRSHVSRPHHELSTASHPHSEVKPRRARIVQTWGTRLEVRVLRFFFHPQTTPTRCTTLISRVSHQHNRCGQAQVA